MLPRSVTQRFESVSSTPFYVGLVLSGIATVLLGPILPLISAKWMLTDAQAGSLFTAQFTTSILGAGLSSYFRRHSVVLGYAAIAAGLGSLSLAHYGAALIGLSLIGLGVGGAVTATNLIFGTEYPEKRGPLLARTNLLWGVGAVAAPQLVGIAERHGALRILLMAIALITLCVSLWLAPLLRRADATADAELDRASTKIGTRIFLLFSVTLFLYVGGETAIAGWTATYAHRFENFSVARSSQLVSAFWLAIVAGRGLAPLLLRMLSELAVLLAGILTAFVGLVLLLSPHSMPLTVVAVALTGLGCAPIFPLATSRLLARVGRSRRSGWIFAICGSGGAVIPWLTGLLSERSGSLRTGFAVPLLAIVVVFLCVLLENALPRSLPLSISDRSKQIY